MKQALTLFALLSLPWSLVAEPKTWATSAPFGLDINSGTRETAGDETLAYDSNWYANGSKIAYKISVNGAHVGAGTGVGSVAWLPIAAGDYTLEYKVYEEGVEQEATYAAQFHVSQGEVPLEIELSQDQFMFADGAAVPQVTVRYQGATLTEGTDYTLAFVDNDHSGLAKVVVTGRGAYSGTVEKQFRILPSVTLSLDIQDGVRVIAGGSVEQIAYENAWDGGTTVKVAVNGVNVVEGGTVGTYEWTPAGIGLYTLTHATYNEDELGNVMSAQFYIPGSLDDAEVVLDFDECLFDGMAKCPTPVVTKDGAVLTQGLDYEVEYQNNVAAGAATVVVVGANGERIERTFTIRPAGICSLDIESGYRQAKAEELLAFDYKWKGDTADNTRLAIRVNDVVLTNITGVGDAVWKPTAGGNYVVTLRTYIDDYLQDEDILPAYFGAEGGAAIPENAVTISGWSGKYDGEAHGVEVTVSDEIENAVVKYSTAADGVFGESLPTIKNVGSQTVWVEISASGYATQTNEATVTITKRAVTLTSGDASGVYSGVAVTNHTVTIGGDGFVADEGAVFTVTGSQLAVGSSANGFAYTLKEGTLAQNYDITKVEGTLTVTKAKVGPTGGDEPGSGEIGEGGLSKFDTVVVYDGEGHTIKTNELVAAFAEAMGAAREETKIWYAVGGSDASDGKDEKDSKDESDGASESGGRGAPALPWGADAPAYTNAGEYVVWYKVTNPNYEDYVHAAKVTITNREIVVTVVGKTASFVYDTTEKSVAGYEVATDDELYQIERDTQFRGAAIEFESAGTGDGDASGASGGHAGRVTLPVIARTDVGVSAMGLKVEDFANTNANFAVTYEVTDGSLEVTAMNISPEDETGAWKIELGEALTYNGLLQTQEVARATFNGFTVDYTLSENAQTNAGAYQLTLTGRGNFAGTRKVDWEISPKALTLVAGSSEKVYDGMPLTVGDVTATGFVAGVAVLCNIASLDFDAGSSSSSETQCRLGFAAEVGLVGYLTDNLGIYGEVGYEWVDGFDASVDGLSADVDFSSLMVSAGVVLAF